MESAQNLTDSDKYAGNIKAERVKFEVTSLIWRKIFLVDLHW